MKKWFFSLAALFVLAQFATAQPGPGAGPWRRSAEERVAVVHAKLDSAFKLDPQLLAAVDTALTVLYKAQDAKRQELMGGGGRPDRETILAEMKKYTDAQDEILKAVLSQEQFDIWKEKIETSMRPQRPEGQGRFPNNRNN